MGISGSPGGLGVPVFAPFVKGGIGIKGKGTESGRGAEDRCFKEKKGRGRRPKTSASRRVELGSKTEARVIIDDRGLPNKGGRMNALTWLFFVGVVVGFFAWLVAGIVRVGNRRAAASEKHGARPTKEADGASEYAAYLAGAADPRD